jgi:hypothetical protein
MYSNIFRLIGLLALLLLPVGTAIAQTLHVGFGKNRVQYHRQFDEWQLYETEHFETYWYGDARNVAIAALQMAEYDYQEMVQTLEHQLSEPVELLVFSDMTDLKQSNIGSDELFQVRLGETKIIGGKIFVYFDGDHRNLRAAVREGIAAVIIQSMMFGTNLQEMVQNAVLLNLPEWYTSGLAAYCGAGWNTRIDHELRSLFLQKKIASFSQLVKHNPRLAGQAFWYYIGRQYGDKSISNLIYLTRINRGLDAGFRYVLGAGYEQTTQTVFDFFKEMYQKEAGVYERLGEVKGRVKIKNKRQLPLYQFKISPDGQRIAWVQNELGRWNVYMQSLSGDKKRIRVMKGGTKNALQATDYNYPLLAWSPDNQQLAILYERRDVIKLALYDRETNKKVTQPISPEFQRVYNFDFINPTDFAFSAEVRGYTDIFLYRSVTRQTERITNDLWDDLDVNYARYDGRRCLLFASNRLSDTLSQQRLDSILPVGQMDVFLYDLDTRSNELLRLTHTPLADERQPLVADSAHFVYLSDQNGIDNRCAGRLEEYVAFYQTTFYLKNNGEANAIDTRQPGEWPLEKALLLYAAADTVRKNLDSTQIDSIRTRPVYKKRSVVWPVGNLDHRTYGMDVSPARAGKLLTYYRADRQSICSVEALSVTPIAPPAATVFQAGRMGTKPLVTGVAPVPEVVKSAPAPVVADSIPPEALFQVPSYLLQQLVGWPVPETIVIETPEEPEDDPNLERLLNKPAVALPPAPKSPLVRFNPSRIVPYRLRFRTDFVTTNPDNNLLFEGLDSYAGSPAGFRTPPPGIMLKANFKELLEDFVVEAGFRLPLTFNGSEYYVWFDNRKRRIDRRYALYRRTVINNIERERPTNGFANYNARTNTLLGQYEMRYPLDPFLSLRGMVTVRQDKTIALSSDRPALETPDYAEQRAALRLGVVYDNTVDVDINLKTGTRARFFVEAVKRFEFNTQPDWSFKLNSGFMTVIQLDARHYQRLDRRSILALRVAGATSFGSERMLYYLGGVDNWLIPRFDQQVTVPQTENFAYEALAAHLRGFRQNIRNGSSYALMNAELRVPIAKYFSKKPTLSNFWRNLQITGFFDAGTAWTGSSPYNSDNPINIVYLQNPPTVNLKVNYFRDPLVAGYGVGLRIPLFGMYLRADYAWGIETRVVQKPLFYLALGADF